MFKLDNLSKTYYTKSLEVEALKNIDLEFNDKGLYYILGPSGNGKSTLLNLLGGLDTPTEGELYINNKNTSTFNEEEWDNYRNHHLGFVFQSFNLLNNLTILENVALKLHSLRKYDNNTIRQMSIDVLNKVGLSNHINKLPTQLSGGQQQRVAIARALVNNPSVILCDEPTGALDVNTSNDVMKIIQEVSNNTLVIIVTHNEQLTNIFPGQTIYINDGKIEHSDKEITQQTIIDINKNQISISKSLKLSIKNVTTNIKRALIVIAACSISISTVLTVFSLSNGLTYELVEIGEEKQVKFPIYTYPNSTYSKGTYNALSTMDNTLYDFIYYVTNAAFYGINEEQTTTYHETKILPENYIELYLQYNVLAGTLDISDDQVIIVLDKYNQSSIVELYFPSLENEFSPSELIGKEIRRSPIDSVYVWSSTTERMNSPSVEYRYTNSEILTIGAVLSPIDLYPENDITSVSNILTPGLYITHDKYRSIIDETRSSDFAYYFDLYPTKNIMDGIEYTTEAHRQKHKYILSLEEVYTSINIVPSTISTKPLLLSELERLLPSNSIITDQVTETIGYTRLTTNMLLVVISIISFISIFVAGTLIFIITYANILQRKKEIGILRSLGITKKKTISIFVLETTIISIISSLFSIFILLIVQIPIEVLAYNHFGYSNIVLIKPLNIILLLLLCNISFYISSYFPVRKGVNIDIAEIVR